MVPSQMFYHLPSPIAWIAPPTGFVPHASLLPRGRIQLRNNRDTLGRSRLFNAKISSADRSGTSHQPPGYSGNTAPAEDKQPHLFMSLSVMLSVMRVR